MHVIKDADRLNELYYLLYCEVSDILEDGGDGYMSKLTPIIKDIKLLQKHPRTLKPSRTPRPKILKAVWKS